MRRLIFFLVSWTAWGQAPGPFTLTDLGLLAGNGACIATAISANGKVAGYCHAAGVAIRTGPPTRGFLYSDKTLTALPAALGTTIVNGVNDAGMVAGFSLPSGTTITNSVLGAVSAPYVVGLSGAQLQQGFWPTALNNTTMAGFLSSLNPSILSPNGLMQAAVFSSGVTNSLPGVPGSNTLGLGISQKGVIAGVTLTVNNLTFAVGMAPVLWRDRVNSSLPAASSMVASAAMAVNDQGLAGGAGFNLSIVPYIADPLASYTMTDLRALLWSNGVLSDITAATGGKYGMVLGVNDGGWAVGFRADAFPAGGMGVLDILLYPDDANFRGFVYAAGKAYDLNTLVTGAAGWTITNATAVSSAGQIAGAGYLNGVEHAILLTPAAPPPGGPVIGGVTGGGLSVPSVTSISSNGYFTIGGSNFAAAGTSRSLGGGDIVNGSLPTNLASTCVNVGTARAFLSYVSPGQINALAPSLSSAATAGVSVVANCGAANETMSTAVTVPVAAATPEFLYWSLSANGQNPVIALDAVTGDFIGPPGLIAGLRFRAARSGDILTLYGVGFGRTISGGPVPGAIPAAADSLSAGYSVTIGGRAAAVSYAGVTPGSAGLYQVNLVVPAGLTSGSHSIVFTGNGLSTSVGGFLVVEP